jgi:hypothetical protein
MKIEGAQMRKTPSTMCSSAIYLSKIRKKQDCTEKVFLKQQKDIKAVNV